MCVPFEMMQFSVFSVMLVGLNLIFMALFAHSIRRIYVSESITPSSYSSALFFFMSNVPSINILNGTLLKYEVDL
jgi:hypothetical protein